MISKPERSAHNSSRHIKKPIIDLTLPNSFLCPGDDLAVNKFMVTLCHFNEAGDEVTNLIVRKCEKRLRV